MANSINITDTSSNIKTMDSILKDTFNVPFYQRNYAWEPMNATNFFDDVLQVVEGNQGVHFFGQIVAYRNGDSKDLIDGQQRITTSCIYLAALKNVVLDLSDQKDKISEDISDELRDIKRDVKKYTRYDEKVPTLTLQKRYNNDDSINKYFRGLFEGRYELVGDNKKIKPIENINKVFVSLYNKIKKYVNDNCEKDNYLEITNVLRSMLDSFIDSFFVSIVETHSQDDAFIIFETLNSTGKDLAPSEIIKTYLLSQMSQDENNIMSYNNKWNELDNKFNSDTDELTAFIRIYWGARFSLVESKNLYRSISSNIKGETKSKSFLEDLLFLSDIYIVANKANKSQSDINFIGDGVISSILDLFRKMGYKVFFPILFSLERRKYNNTDKKIVLYKVLSVFVRRVLICGYSSNKIEPGFANIAQKIFMQKISGVNDIVDELNNLRVSDKSVKLSFSALSKHNGNGRKGWVLRYLLLKYLELDGDISEVRIDSMTANKYNVVQISNDDSISEEYLEYIGNYVLIEGNLSSDIDVQHNIEDVMEALSSSKFQSNIDLYKEIKENGWHDEDILKRQNNFSDKSIDIWK